MASKTFTHVFSGVEADARYWTNSDGSEGGIVAVSASIHGPMRIPKDAVIGPRANIGYGVTIGNGVSIGNDASIGPRATIDYGATIGNDANIGPRATIGEGADIGEGATIGEGAVIGPRATINYGASVGNDATIGEGVSIGYGATVGYGAVIGEGDWWGSCGPIGSRDGYATYTYSKAHGLRWWIGCQQGISTTAFRARIARRHAGTKHEDDYLALIEYVKSHPGLARAIAADENGVSSDVAYDLTAAEDDPAC